MGNPIAMSTPTPVLRNDSAQLPPDVGMFGGIGIGYRQAQSAPDIGTNETRYLNDIYEETRQALIKKGFGGDYTPETIFGTATRGTAFADMFVPKVARPHHAFFDQLAAARAADPNFMAKFSDVTDADSARARAIHDQQSDAAKANADASRLTGMGSVGSFIGGVGAQWDDPDAYLGLVAGAPAVKGVGIARGIVTTMVREGAANTAFAAVEEPLVDRSAARLGVERTWSDTAWDLTTQGVFGGVVGGVVHGLGRVPEALRARREAAGTLDDHAAVDAAREAIPDENRTPTERAALRAITETSTLAEQSPYAPVTGDLPHMLRSTEATKALRAGVMPPGAHPPFESAWGAIIGNEGGTAPDGSFRTSPKGAIGPAQVMPGTAPEAARLAGLPFDDHLYRTDPAYNDKLGRAYFANLLRKFDGDAEKAAAAYNSGEGSAKTGRGVKGAMARAEAAGTPENWRAFLPKETQDYVANFRRRTGSGDGRIEAPDAPVDREAEFAAREAGIAGEQEAIDAAPARVDAEPVHMPELRREMFDDDVSWRRAQYEADMGHAVDVETPRIETIADDAAPPARVVEATVPQSEAADDGLGPSSIVRFLPESGEPGVSVISDEGHFATAVFRDAEGRAVAAVKMPTSPEGRAITTEVSSFVRPEYRRKGIATKLYNALKNEGHDVDTLSATGDLTPDGAAFVNARRANPPARMVEPGGAPTGGTLSTFGDIDGAGQRTQVQGIEHDLRMRAVDMPDASFVVDGGPMKLSDIMAEIDKDEAMTKALRACLGGAA